MINSLEELHDDPKEVEFLIPLIKDSVERLRKKIKELSTIGKEQETKKKRKPIAYFKDTFNDVLLDLEKDMENSGAEISCDFSQVPKIAFPKKNLKSIIQNLLSNSLKFRSPDRKLKISAWTEKTKNYVVLNVKDNGLGIKEEDKERIFRMYQRAHTHIEGTGVGLGIVKKIIKNSGGKIELESKIGEGALFKIYIQV